MLREPGRPRLHDLMTGNDTLNEMGRTEVSATKVDLTRDQFVASYSLKLANGAAFDPETVSSTQAECHKTHAAATEQAYQAGLKADQAYMRSTEAVAEQAITEAARAAGTEGARFAAELDRTDKAQPLRERMAAAAVASKDGSADQDRKPSAADLAVQDVAQEYPAMFYEPAWRIKGDPSAP